MVTTFLYLFLAILGLGFLIFIHELGHYWMARRVGMKVEAFSIGFGKPIFSWERDGVKWQLAWLPFGGYVKIAGMEKEDGKDPHEIPYGFFGKSPWARIKVAFSGPLINIAFAFLAFTLLWISGGREKKFSEFTSHIGWVDPHSELFQRGTRPGDTIDSYDDNSFQGFKDHLYAAMIGGSDVNVLGHHINYKTGEATPYNITVHPYQHPSSVDKGILTVGVLNSANYLIFDPDLQNSTQVFPEGSPMLTSGIQKGDRLLWLDGELIHSLQHLTHILNDGRALLTIERDGKRLLARVPRVSPEELKLDPVVKEEFIDWQHEAQLSNLKSKVLVIPYDLNADATVTSELKFIDPDKQLEAFPAHPLSDVDLPLLEGDKIVAVDGVPIKYSYQLLYQLQSRRVNIIVESTTNFPKGLNWKEADHQYNRLIDWTSIQKLSDSIGASSPVTVAGPYRLLNPISPKTRLEFATTPEKQAQLKSELLQQRKEVENIQDSERRNFALQQLNQKEKQLLLGLPSIQDLPVRYNPPPTELFSNVGQEIWRTLKALLSGYLNPKWMSGPIGIVQVVQENWKLGFKEGLFWLGAISLNLGILNLLPIPVLDGGYICMAFFELITGRKIKTKTMEKLILPFAVLLICFFIFLTYHDLMRLFGTLF